MGTNTYKTWIEIGGSALRHNVELAKRKVGKNTAIIAVIKANAYGHGLREVAASLKDVKGIWFGVDSIDEAKQLNEFKLKKPIIILGYIPASRLLEALQANFHISVYSAQLFYKITKILKNNSDITPHLHLKIETGTNRLGIALKDLVQMKISLPIDGVYTHFADVEDTKSKYYQKQLETFRRAIWILRQKNIFVPFVHSASSAALIQYKETHFSMARLGIALYGLWPSENIKHKHVSMKLKPALSWKTRIAQIKIVAKGSTVGYDRVWRAKRDSTIAVLPVGYYDGYDRKLYRDGDVLINGKRAPIVGKICMNMMMVDITGIFAREDDEAVLLGKCGREEITAEDIAKKIGTINYEVVARINPLLPRIIKK